MASYVDIVLDTTGPAGVSVSIDGGAVYTTDLDVLLTIGTTDPDTTGYQMKVWGDVDLTDNANIQDTEAHSSWIAFSTSQAVKLLTGDGAKSVTVRVRDDVWNESSTATDSITLDSTLPSVNITSGPTPAKISKVTGKDESVIVWESDSQYDEYEVRVVPSTTSPHTAGTLIGSSGGSSNVSGTTPNQPAATPVTTTINGEDLEDAAGADGTWHVRVYVKDDAGNWSV